MSEAGEGGVGSVERRHQDRISAPNIKRAINMVAMLKLMRGLTLGRYPSYPDQKVGLT